MHKKYHQPLTFLSKLEQYVFYRAGTKGVIIVDGDQRGIERRRNNIKLTY